MFVASKSMVIWNIFLTGPTLLFLVLNCLGRRSWDMGCECGIRKLTSEDEEKCEESAKLEDPEAGKNSILQRLFFQQKSLSKYVLVNYFEVD